MWLNWIILGVVGVVVLFALGLPLLVFAAALIERRRVLQLEPLADEDRPASSKAQRLHDEALAAGLLYFATFRDHESKLATMRLSAYLSEDGLVLMILPAAARTLGYRLYSRMADGVWLETGQVTGDTDLSGLRRSAMLPDADMQGVLAFHLERVGAYGNEALPFDPQTLVDDLYQHDYDRAEKTIAMGLARWVRPEQKVWVLTLRGAVCMMVNTMLSVQRVTKANRDAASRDAS